jgi:hypothetical protein
MIDSICGKKPNTIEVCSNSVVKGKDCFIDCASTNLNQVSSAADSSSFLVVVESSSPSS